MKSHSDIDCYFIEFTSLLFAPLLTEDTLYLRGQESYKAITSKTIQALDFFFFRNKYDFVIRTNLSSVWIFPKLMTFMGTLPKTGYYGGVVNTYKDLRYVSGTCITMSHDVVRTLLQNRNVAYMNGHIDDVDIGVALKSVNIHPAWYSTPRVDIDTIADIEKDGFHYRVRFLYDRHREPDIMLSILNNNTA